MHVVRRKTFIFVRKIKLKPIEAALAIFKRIFNDAGDKSVSPLGLSLLPRSTETLKLPSHLSSKYDRVRITNRLRPPHFLGNDGNTASTSQ